MGFRSSWVAVKGLPLERVLALGGWSDTGERTEMLDTGLYAVVLRDGWIVVLGSGWDYMDQVTPEHAERLSHLGDTLFLTQSDGSMDAEIRGFAGGRERWSVIYVGTDGVSDPVIAGPVPELLAAIVDRCTAEQTAAGGRGVNVDHMYDIPAELGLAIIGFRHDDVPDVEDAEPYHVIEPT